MQYRTSRETASSAIGVYLEITLKTIDDVVCASESVSEFLSNSVVDATTVVESPLATGSPAAAATVVEFAGLTVVAG